MSSITDPEVAKLAELIEGLCNTTVKRDWPGSPFNEAMSYSSRAKGSIGEKLVEKWCIEKGLEVSPSPDTEADRIIEGNRVEIKLSFLTKENRYMFEQIRKQNYSHIICLGISPFESHLWVVPKNILLDSSGEWKDLPNFKNQHGGKKALDRILSFNSTNPPVWLSYYGGSLSQGTTKLLELKVNK